MTTTQRRKLVTVPRGLYATVKAIEKSGLVNITSTGITEVTGLTYQYAIVGDDPSDEILALTLELTGNEFNAIQAALGRATGTAMTATPRVSFTSDTDGVDKLELLHLRTLLAEAAAPKDTT